MSLLTIYSKIRPRTRRIIFGFLIAGIIIGVGCSTVYRAGFDVKLRTDLSIYKAAGQTVLDGKNPYTAENERTWYFTSPPIVAILCIPLTWNSVTWDAVLVYLISIGMLALIALLSSKIIPEHAKQRKERIVGLTFAICSIYFSDVLTRGQFGILVLLCLITTLYGWITGKRALAGWALGFAVSIKVTPAGLLPLFFLYKKEYRIFFWSALSAFVFSIVIPSFFYGIHDACSYLFDWARRVPLSVFPIPPTIDELYSDNFKFWRQIHDPFIFRNQSLFSVFVRLLRNTQEDMIARGVVAARVLSGAISFTTLLVSAFVLKTKRASTEAKTLEFSVPIIILLSSTTLAWTHYFSCLYVAYLALLCTTFSPSLTKRNSMFLIWVVSVSALFMLLGYASKPLQRVGFITWSSLVILSGMLWSLGKIKEATNLASSSANPSVSRRS